MFISQNNLIKTNQKSHSSNNNKNKKKKKKHYSEKLYFLFLIFVGIFIILFSCAVIINSFYNNNNNNATTSNNNSHSFRIQNNDRSSSSSSSTTSSTNNNNNDNNKQHHKLLQEFLELHEHRKNIQHNPNIRPEQKIFEKKYKHKPTTTITDATYNNNNTNTNTNNNNVVQQQQESPPQQQQPEQQQPPYYLIFSTSCIDQQHWESYVLFYHAYKVKQQGNITRIVSGCNDKEKEQLLQFHNKYIYNGLSNKFHIHFTPDFSKIMKKHPNDNNNRQIGYKYMNKPFGVYHWFQYGPLHMSIERSNNNMDTINDGIVMLLDPDMILLRPLVHDYTNDTSIIYANNDKHPLTKIVKHGYPMAQQDGYLNNQWKTLNITYILSEEEEKNNKNEKTKKTLPPLLDGPKHYNTGPPYLATVRDMYHIVTLWTKYGPRIYNIFPKLFAEMFGYIIATTQLHLPHTMFKSIVISTTSSNTREGWELIDNLVTNNICILDIDKRTNQYIYPSPTLSTKKQIPIILHYCKRYFLGKWFFSKYRLKKNYISCNTPILTYPQQQQHDDNNTNTLLSKYNYWIQPPPANYKYDKDNKPWIGENKTMSFRQSKREAFMLCSMISAVNEASRHFKMKHCYNTTTGQFIGNMNETYTIYNDPGKY